MIPRGVWIGFWVFVLGFAGLLAQAQAQVFLRGCATDPGQAVACPSWIGVPVSEVTAGTYRVNAGSQDLFVAWWANGEWWNWQYRKAGGLSGMVPAWQCSNSASCATQYAGVYLTYEPMPLSCPGGQHLEAGICVPDIVPQTMDQRVAALEQTVVYLQSQLPQAQEPFDPVFAGQVFSFFCAGVLLVFWIAASAGAVVSAVRKF